LSYPKGAFAKAPFLFFKKDVQDMIKARFFIPTPTCSMEDLKHKVLAALYQKDSPRILRGCTAVLAAARTKKMGENDEKHLRQIQVAVRKIYMDAPANTACQNLPPRLKKIYAALQSLLRDRARQGSPGALDYETWQESAALDQWQQRGVFQTAITFQLTSGCSNFCRRCNEWALPRVRAHFTLGAASTIMAKLVAAGNRDLALYGGSDPLDWEDGHHSLGDLLARADARADFSLLTKVPRGRQALLKTLVRQGVDIAVSLTNRNRTRIQRIEAELGQTLTKQHATPDLLIPACLDEDFHSVKPSITDSYGSEISLDGACIIIPTFTSALHPFGHKKIPVTSQTPWFPVKKLGRPALLQDYFKPLQVMGKDQRVFTLPRLLDVQVENILLDNGRQDLTPPGMRSVKEYFEVFDQAPRLQRKAMTLSVMRRLKRSRQKSYADMIESEKQEYRNKIAAHLDFTRRDRVLEARTCSAAFFLAAAQDYLLANPVKAAIIAALTRQEADTLGHLPDIPLARAFADPSQDAWHLFRQQILVLIHAPHRASAPEFTESRPTRYDSDRDLFVLI
jgi:hypothetical protein